MTLAFVTPASGKIWVTITASAKAGTTIAAFPAITFAITGAAGTVAASDNYQAFNQTVDTSSRPENTLFRRQLITGLVAGAAGTITMHHKIGGGGTGTFTNRQLQWEPVAA